VINLICYIYYIILSQTSRKRLWTLQCK
jgi:hypothetical protein